MAVFWEMSPEDWAQFAAKANTRFKHKENVDDIAQIHLHTSEYSRGKDATANKATN